MRQACMCPGHASVLVFSVGLGSRKIHGKSTEVSLLLLTGLNLRLGSTLDLLSLALELLGELSGLFLGSDNNSILLKLIYS